MLLRRCLVCGEPVASGPLCAACQQKIEDQFFDSRCRRCPKCFAVLPFEGCRCRFCSEHPGHRLLVASPYEGFSAKLLERLKFFGMRELANVAGWVFRKLIDGLRHAGAPGLSSGASDADAMVPESRMLVVPVPASPQGIKKRGFDQMVLVAKATGLPWESALERAGAGEQKARDKKGRIEAAGHLFRAKAGLDLSGRTVFVIDDITTTGATILAAMEALGAPKPNIAGVVWLGGAPR